MNKSIYWILLLTGLLSACSSGQETSLTDTRPNVLLIFTDQQHVNMMSAAGNPYLNTPNMDKLAKRGVMFRQSYCTSPVCGPARSSIITGLMPHQTGVEWNGDSIKAGIRNVGEIFRTAGYETTWAGKWHLPESYPQRAKAKQKTIKGFDLLPFRDPEIENWMLGSETDPPLSRAVVKYLNAYDQVAPFFLAVSYHNPHDICFYPRKEGWVNEGDSLLEIRHYGFEYKLPEVVGTHPDHYADLPPLPDNHGVEHNEPEFISDKRKYHQEYGVETNLAYQEFGDAEWQGYLNAYYRLTEQVDAEIGKVLAALEANNLDENTLIIFTADHGDGAAAHKWSAKLSLYNESATVPMLVSFPGHIPENQVDSHNLVSQIDIVPTLCDYAGLNTESKITGKSMRPIIDNPKATWRDYIVVELADFKPDRQRKGRMLRTATHKYTIFSSGDRNEQLFEVGTDPGEIHNLATLPEMQKVRSQHMMMLQNWMRQWQDVNFGVQDTLFVAGE